MIKRSGTGNRKHSLASPFAALVLALALCMQLALPAFAADAPEENPPPEPPPAGSVADEQPEPADEAPGEDEDAPAEDEAPEEADTAPEEAAAAAEESAPEETAPAAEGDIVIGTNSNEDEVLWTELPASIPLQAGSTLTIRATAGQPDEPTVVTVTGASGRASIVYEGSEVLQDLRVRVGSSNLTLHIKNLKLRAAESNQIHAAIDFSDVFNSYGVTSALLSGTLEFEGSNEVYATSSTSTYTSYSQVGPAGVRANKLTLRGTTATSSLKAVGAQASAFNHGGAGIFADCDYNVPTAQKNQPNALVLESGIVEAIGGDALDSSPTTSATTGNNAGHGLWVHNGQAKIMGTLSARGGSAVCTRRYGGKGVYIQAPSLSTHNLTPETAASEIGPNAVVTAYGGDADSESWASGYPGDGFVYEDYSYTTRIPMQVRGKLTGYAGRYFIEHGYESRNPKAVVIRPVTSDSDDTEITGISRYLKGDEAECNAGTGVQLWLEGDSPLKGTVNADIRQDGRGDVNSDAGIQLWSYSRDDDPNWVADRVIDVEADLNVLHSSEYDNTGVSPGICIEKYNGDGQDDYTFRLLGQVNAGYDMDAAGRNGWTLRSNLNLTIGEGAKVHLRGIDDNLSIVDALHVMGDLTVEGELNAMGGGHYSSPAGLPVKVDGGKLAIKSTANVTLRSAFGSTHYGSWSLPLLVTDGEATVEAGATVKDERGQNLYQTKLTPTGTPPEYCQIVIARGLRYYSAPFGVNAVEGYTLLPAERVAALNVSASQYYDNLAASPGFTVQPSHNNEYVYDLGTHPPLPTAINFASTNIQLEVGEVYYLDSTCTPTNSNSALRFGVHYGSDAMIFQGDKVTAIADGTKDMTVYAFGSDGYGALRVDLTITVGSGTPPAPSLTLQQGGVAYTGGTLPLGQSLQLSAVAANVSGSPTVSWSSSKTSVATVSNSGLVTPKAVGTTSIKAEITVNSKKYAASCNIEVVDEPVELTSVSITPANTQLALGRTRTLHATPNEGASLDGAAIAWDVVSSSPVGVVALTPAADGKTASLKASDTISGSATVQVVVTPEGGAALPAATLTVNVSEGLGGMAFTQAYKVLHKSTTPVDITSLIEFTPDSYTPDNLVLSTSNARVVELEKADGKTTGKIIAKALGAADITVEAWDDDDDERFKAVLSVKVAAPITAGSFKLNATSKTMNTGTSFQLKASSAPANATLDRLAWNIEGPAGVVSVDDTGLVTAIGPGTATVKATGYDLFGTEFTADCEVKVNHLAQGVSLTDADGVALSPTSMITLVPAGHEDTELPGDRRFFNTRVILPVAEPSSTTDLVSVKSSSSAVKAAYSKDTGITLTGNKAGSATITVSLGKKKTTVKAQVVVPPNSGENTGLKFKDPAAYAKDLAVNASRTLKLDFASRVSGAAPGKAVAWSSSNPAIATVAKGKVKAVSPGTVTITAASTLDSRAIATVTLKVVAPITSIRFNQANFPMERDTTETLSLTLNGGLPASTEDAALTGLSYSIDKPEVLWFVDDGGAKVENPVFASDGSFRVKAAKVEAKATAKVTVKSPEKSITGYAQKNASLTVTVLTEAPVKASALTFSNKAKAPGYTDGSKTVPPLAVGKSFTPSAKVDSKASNKTVLWSITATDGKPLDYVVFDATTGKVTGKAPSGSAELTVTGVPMWGESTVVPASFTFKVAKLVTSISIAGEKQMAVNASQLLTPTLTASATDLSLTWKSSNPAVVKLYDAAGDTELDPAAAVAGPVTVKTLKSGSATITATSPDAGKKKVSFKISVVQQVEKVEITVPTKYVSGSDAAIDRGQSMSLKPRFLNAAGDATIKPKNTKVSWSIVNDPKGAITLSSKGVVKGVADGTAVVRVTSLDGGKTDELTITVTAKATAVAMGQASFKLYSGNTRTLTLNANTTPLLGQLSAGHNSLKWTIADSSRLAFADGQGTVSSEGSKSILTTAPGVGSVEIRVNPAIAITGSQTLKCDVSVATVSGKTRKITVSIVGKESAAPMVKGITVKKSTWLGIGKKETLKAGFEPTNAANKNLRWAVFTDAECTTPYTGAGVTVSAKGQVVAKAAGTYYVRAESVDGAFKAVCTVYVVPKN